MTDPFPLITFVALLLLGLLTLFGGMAVLVFEIGWRLLDRHRRRWGGRK